MIRNGDAWLGHVLLVAGVAATCFPLYMAVIASTHDTATLAKGIPLLPGAELGANLRTVFGPELVREGSGAPLATMLLNSAIMAMLITVGKIAVSLLAAYAVVFFRFPLRTIAFWLIFITLMLPVEVRIVPTYSVVANLGMLDSFTGLSLPLIASATATFMFRQVFLTIPDELTEAARIDGAGPMRFFVDIVIPLSRTNIAALFVILFVYGWNQYLWPLLITNDPGYTTVVMGIQRLIDNAERAILWNVIMPTTLIATLPPIVVVVVMQRLFVKGLVETEK